MVIKILEGLLRAGEGRILKKLSIVWPFSGRHMLVAGSRR